MLTNFSPQVCYAGFGIYWSLERCVNARQQLLTRVGGVHRIILSTVVDAWLEGLTKFALLKFEITL